MRTMLEIGKDLLNLFGEVNRPEVRDQSRKDATDLFVDVMKDFFQYVAERPAWHSVEDEVPPDIDPVLVWVPEGKQKNIHFRDCVLFASYDTPDGWMLEDYPDVEEVTITHWMELPEGPEVKA